MTLFDILAVVAPVFLVIAAGQGALRTKILNDESVEGLMRFTNYFGFPILLFGAIARLDLGAEFDPSLLATFYIGSTASFFLAMFGARFIFRREWPDSVVIGFGGLFTNGFVLGIPISERALGIDALGPNFAIISVHSPYCYLIGVTAMEIARAGGQSVMRTVQSVFLSMTRNPLVMGLAAGFALNFSGLTLPEPVWEAVDLIGMAALPAALVGFGGILTRYNFGRSAGAATMVSLLSLGLHPFLVTQLGAHVFHLPDGQYNSALLTAAMAPGLNMYIFASLYQRAIGAAASTLIMGTSLSVLTVSAWMFALRL